VADRWDDRQTRVLVEVVRRPGITHPELASAVGCSVSTVHAVLWCLREAGLVDWEIHHRGTLHALVQPVRWYQGGIVSGCPTASTETEGANP
jgi:hypothetical protein